MDRRLTPLLCHEFVAEAGLSVSRVRLEPVCAAVPPREAGGQGGRGGALRQVVVRGGQGRMTDSIRPDGLSAPSPMTHHGRHQPLCGRPCSARRGLCGARSVGAPLFAVASYDGRGPVRLAAFRGRLVRLNFWAS